MSAKYALQNVSTEDIAAQAKKARAIHPQEPCRVGMYVGALEEVLRLRAERDAQKGIVEMSETIRSLTAQRDAAHKALELVINTVDCPSIETRPAPYQTGTELPWYAAAKKALGR